MAAMLMLPTYGAMASSVKRRFMKKKVLIKWIIGCGMLCMMLLVLWKRTHINYDEYSDKTSDMQHEEVEEIRFPDYINEKVSDGLVFDAEVVIGENFDPDNFYVSTARIMKPDEEKWNTLSVYEMFFLFDIGDDKVKFAPIDNIKECIKTKYGKTLDENCITVKKWYWVSIHSQLIRRKMQLFRSGYVFRAKNKRQ